MTKPLDYSRWNHIEISDDEDDQHPNIDKESLWRWKKQARVEREMKEAAEKQRIRDEHIKIKSRLIEAEQTGKQEILDELKKQEEEYDKKEKEIARMEELYPKWNSSNLCKDAWSKTLLSDKTPEKTEEEIAKEQSKFMKENKEAIRHYALLTNNEDTEKYLMEHQHLVCDATANYLVVWAVDLQVEEKPAMVAKVAKQTILMQYLLEIAKGASKQRGQIITGFFSKFKLAEQQYKQAYDEEVAALVTRVEKRAKERVEEALQEYEAEEKAKRIAASPGGVDPQEVMESLPKVLRDAFESRDIAALQKAIADMPLEDAKYHIDRCTKSGLWVPGGDDTPENEDEPS
eukprot:Ihof_evm2s135 gene=Ihof_evmTU2s135